MAYVRFAQILYSANGTTGPVVPGRGIELTSNMLEN
jgi:hypothetical protein